jgi:hypothetical protein
MRTRRVPPAVPDKPPPKVRMVRMKVADLRPADYNPRKIDADSLAGLGKSVSRFGLVQPVVFNVRTGNVVGGHQRLKVVTDDEIDVAQIDVSSTDEKALNIALNSPKISGEFTGALEALLAEIRAADADLFTELRLDAFTDADLAKLTDGAPLDDLWAGMPEFTHTDKNAFRSMMVHFVDQAAVDDFAAKLGCQDRMTNRYLWWPVMEIDWVQDIAYESDRE